MKRNAAYDISSENAERWTKQRSESEAPYTLKLYSTGCPKSSPLYFMSFFQYDWINKQIFSTNVVSFNLIH